jgi:hypothetical protein
MHLQGGQIVGGRLVPHLRDVTAFVVLGVLFEGRQQRHVVGRV